MSAAESHRAAEAEGPGGEVLGAVLSNPSPWYTCRRPGPPGPGMYSAASIPMRARRHSSVSQPPVEMAMLGISPSVWLLGRVRDLSGCGLSTHGFTVVIVSCLRHLPTWMTSGMFGPSGTFSRVNLPDASV